MKDKVAVVVYMKGYIKTEKTMGEKWKQVKAEHGTRLQDKIILK